MKKIIMDIRYLFLSIIFVFLLIACDKGADIEKSVGVNDSEISESQSDQKDKKDQSDSKEDKDNNEMSEDDLAEPENQEVSLNGYIYRIKKVSKGIDQEWKDLSGEEREIFDYSLQTISVEANEEEVEDSDNKLLEEIIFEDPADSLVSIELNSEFLDNLIKIEFRKGLDVSVYSGYKFYKASESDGKLDLVLTYFEAVGVQDEPMATIQDIKIIENQIELDYEYVESIDLPKMGYGHFKVFYQINDEAKTITFSDIFCEITRTDKFVDGDFIEGDPYAPEDLIFTKEELNDKFRYILKYYLFLD